MDMCMKHECPLTSARKVFRKNRVGQCCHSNQPHSWGSDSKQEGGEEETSLELARNRIPKQRLANKGTHAGKLSECSHRSRPSALSPPDPSHQPTDPAPGAQILKPLPQEDIRGGKNTESSCCLFWGRS